VSINNGVRCSTHDPEGQTAEGIERRFRTEEQEQGKELHVFNIRPLIL
jgi:hypothetical protein